MLDFYSGFEGEREICFALRGVGPQETGVRMWEGYLHTIMEQIHPENGRWTGLALPYHLLEWYDEPWKASNLQEILAQWERVPVAALDETTQKVHSAVLALLRSAVASGGELWITQD